jgi:tight adherence protein B
MSPLWQDPIGIGIVKYMLFLMVIGIFILKTIVRIRV